ncbi:MAG: acyl-CoA dehydrogenase family protein [Pseudolabrys sp.]
MRSASRTAAFKDMVNYMNERVQSGRRIVDFQANQFAVADMATDLVMAECWLDYVASLIESGGKDFGLEASMAKMRASDLAIAHFNRGGADARRLRLLQRIIASSG